MKKILLDFQGMKTLEQENPHLGVVFSNPENNYKQDEDFGI